jgi:hypothetical protein
MFAFIESFFLLSLGITFILIFLMVFHFKQRIEKLEKKNNNLSDLSNKIVKEIANLHSIYLMNQHQNQHQKNLINPREHICENIRITTSIPIPNNNFNENENNNANSPYKKIVVMDTIVDDDIMTVESSDSSEYEYNDSELDSESESVLLEEVVDIPIKDSKEEIHVIQLYDDEYKSVKESKESSEKIFNDLVNEERETIVVKEEVEKESEVFVQTTNYQKMNISKLRILAISKGLCSDTSKIKRADLIKLLESEEN